MASSLEDLARFPMENHEPVLRVDVAGRILFANPAARILTNQWPEGRVAPHVFNALDAEGTSIVEAEGRTFRVVMTRVAGRPYHNVYAVDESGRVAVMRELEAARDAAQAANEAKTVFVATMSHEMRTPLNVIIGMTELALDTSLAPDQREYLSATRASGESLLALISGILDFSSIGAGAFELASVPFDIRSLVREVVEVLTVQATAAGLRMRLRTSEVIPERVVGDPNRIRQILVNLLSNALKYTERGGVEVRLHVRPHGQSVLIALEVEDSGIGIDPEDINRIFEPFSQVGPRKNQVVGTGLGLHITRELVECMGGLVEVSSTVGVGSIFRVRLELPRGYPRRGTTIRPVPTRAALGQAPILVVEDHPENRVVIGQRLRNVGHRVMFATCSADAIHLATREALALVLMDVHLGERIDGVDVTREIRKFEVANGRRRVPIVALTGHATQDVRRACLAAGMDDFLTKPIRSDDLLAAVEQWTAERETLLVVDDAPDARRLLVHLLERMFDVEILEAGTAEAALELAMDREKISGVLLDMRLPDAHGTEVARLLRKSRRTRNVPIIGLSADVDEGSIRAALDAGCDEFVQKPIRRGELEEAVRRCLEGRPLADLDEMPTECERPIAHVDEDLLGLVSLFMQDRHKDAENLEAAVRARDWATVARIGHSMKGCGSSYGFDFLSQLGAAIERAAGDARAVDVGVHVDELRDYLGTVRVMSRGATAK